MYFQWLYGFISSQTDLRVREGRLERDFVKLREWEKWNNGFTVWFKGFTPFAQNSSMENWNTSSVVLFLAVLVVYLATLRFGQFRAMRLVWLYSCFWCEGHQVVHMIKRWSKGIVASLRGGVGSTRGNNNTKGSNHARWASGGARSGDSVGGANDTRGTTWNWKVETVDVDNTMFEVASAKGSMSSARSSVSGTRDTSVARGSAGSARGTCAAQGDMSNAEVTHGIRGGPRTTICGFSWYFSSILSTFSLNLSIADLIWCNICGIWDWMASNMLCKHTCLEEMRWIDSRGGHQDMIIDDDSTRIVWLLYQDDVECLEIQGTI